MIAPTHTSGRVKKEGNRNITRDEALSHCCILRTTVVLFRLLSILNLRERLQRLGTTRPHPCSRTRPENTKARLQQHGVGVRQQHVHAHGQQRARHGPLHGGRPKRLQGGGRRAEEGAEGPAPAAAGGLRRAEGGRGGGRAPSASGGVRAEEGGGGRKRVQGTHGDQVGSGRHQRGAPEGHPEGSVGSQGAEGGGQRAARAGPAAVCRWGRSSGERGYRAGGAGLEGSGRCGYASGVREGAQRCGQPCKEAEKTCEGRNLGKMQQCRRCNSDHISWRALLSSRGLKTAAEGAPPGATSIACAWARIKLMVWMVQYIARAGVAEDGARERVMQQAARQAVCQGTRTRLRGNAQKCAEKYRSVWESTAGSVIVHQSARNLCGQRKELRTEERDTERTEERKGGAHNKRTEERTWSGK